MPSIMRNDGDGEEWTRVHRNAPSSCRRRRRNHGNPKLTTETKLHNGIAKKSVMHCNIKEDDVTEEQIEAALKQCRQEIKESKFWKVMITPPESCLRRSTIQCIVCYGIGTFGTKRPSPPLWQLSLALEIRDFVSLSNTSGGRGNISSTFINDNDSNNDSPLLSPVVPLHYFEPLMTQREAVILKKLGIQIIPDNERGHRRIGSASTEPLQTLFFMPHCPMQLYSNVLFTNWDYLRQHTMIFGNSLSRYIDEDQHHQLILVKEKQRSLRVLRTLQPFWKEERLIIGKEDIQSCAAYFEQAFNDSGFTYFPSPTLHSSLTTKSWPERPETYLQHETRGDNDEEVL